MLQEEAKAALVKKKIKNKTAVKDLMGGIRQNHS